MSVWSTFSPLRARLRANSSLRRFYSEYVFQQGDIALCSRKMDEGRRRKETPTALLTKYLQPGNQIQTPYGALSMDDIIGNTDHSVVSTPKGVEFQVRRPTLAEYVKLTPRNVTPIYPSEASLIVSLLDLHPGELNYSSGEPLEIFEAGTGHGSLTLHLARAIHGANADAIGAIKQPLQWDNKRLNKIRLRFSQKSVLESFPTTVDPEDPNEESGGEAVGEQDWKLKRRAVIHSLDNSAVFQLHAREIVRGFRRGLYAPDVDFHLGTIPGYLSGRLSQSQGEPFLNHAILDIPDTHEYVEMVAKALKPGGILITWNPSVTQVGKIFEHVKRMRVPLKLENCLETGAGIQTGGREWEVKVVRPRAVERAEYRARTGQKAPTSVSETESEDSEPESVASDTSAPSPQDDSVMIARPKVGDMISGGGFIGVWRRTRE